MALPAQPPETPGLPENADLLEFTGWAGMSLKAPRISTPRDKAYFLQNVMPLGPNNIVDLPDIGPSFYTPPGGSFVNHFDFFGLSNGGGNPWSVIFLDDGRGVVREVFSPNTEILFAPPGTFSFVPPRLPAVVQYGVQFLLIVTEQSDNAYFIWDGAIFYQAGSISPETNLTSGGVGAYSSSPAVTIFGGSGASAAATATIVNGFVTQVTITNAGSGFLVTDPPQLILVFSGGGGPSTAYGTATVANGVITNLTIVNGGSGFTSIPTINISDPAGTGASAIVTAISGGVITGVLVTNGGHGYVNPSFTTTPGSSFAAQATIQNGVINGYIPGSVGSGYGDAPTVRFIAASGSGASATAILSGGTVVGLNFGASAFTGFGYPTATGAVLVEFDGGAGPASGTVTLMPFGINGYSIEVYDNQVWIASDRTVVKKIFSAPGSAVDFNPAHGAGAAPVTDSNLRYQLTRMIQSNGFLYEIGDSRINYISGVQTSAGSATQPPITTFSDLNVDPQIGSPWRDSCTVYSRAVMVVNPFGVHAIYGGAVQKVSTELDPFFLGGVYAGAIPNAFGYPSSAVTTLFGVHCYVLLLPVVDPLTSQGENLLLLWDGTKWWSALQSVSLVAIRTLEWGSNITAWGLDVTRTQIRQLFASGGASLTKTIVSRLSREPHIALEKKEFMLYAMWSGNGAGTATLHFTWDTDQNLIPITQGAFTGGTSPLFASWARSKAPPAIGFATGFTMTSNSVGFTLVDVLQILLERRLKT